MLLRRSGAVATACIMLALAAAGCAPDLYEAAAVDVVTEVATPTPVPTTPPLPLPLVESAVPEPSSTPEPPVTIAMAPAAAPTATEAAPAAAATNPASPAGSVPSAPTSAPTTSPSPAAATSPAPAPSATAAPPATPAPTTPAPTAAPAPAANPYGDHRVSNVGYITFAKGGLAWLTLPSDVIELIGFHEAGHPGSRAINAAAVGVAVEVLESRSRGTAPTSAADIVVPPNHEIRAPVTGTVVAANTYTLYCEYSDQLVYIQPDGLPDYQVRMFHVQGTTPAVGTRVEAGVTVIADRAHQLPFESQVDELTAEPSWPHVHIEVIDTSIPDTRPPGPGCD